MSRMTIDLTQKGKPKPGLTIEEAWTEAARRNLLRMREAMGQAEADHVEIFFQSADDQWGITGIDFVSDRNTTIRVAMESSRAAVAAAYHIHSSDTYTVDETVETLGTLGACLTHNILGAASQRMGIWDDVPVARMPDAFGTIFVRQGEVEVDMRKRVVVASSWRLTDEQAALHHPAGEPAPELTRIPEPGSDLPEFQDHEAPAAP